MELGITHVGLGDDVLLALVVARRERRAGGEQGATLGPLEGVRCVREARDG